MGSAVRQRLASETNWIAALGLSRTRLVYVTIDQVVGRCRPRNSKSVDLKSPLCDVSEFVSEFTLIECRMGRLL